MPLHGAIGGSAIRHFGLTAAGGPTNYPLNITATANSSGQITINWTNASKNFSIRVYRGGSLLTTLAKGTTSYANSGLVGNTAYTYQLAYFGSGIEKKEPTTHAQTTCYSNGAYLSSYCSGTNLYNTYADGNCGSSSANQGQVNNNCGYYDPAGTNYGFQYCSGTSSIYLYADGSGGTYTAGSNINNQCGYCDPYGTDYGNQGYFCSGQELHHTEVYANGSCGTYTQNINDGYVQYSCGYYYPYGTYYYEYCSGTQRIGVFWNGSGGTYTAAIGYTQGYCGYCDPYGTYYGDQCGGYGYAYNHLVQVYANGSCGTYGADQGLVNGNCGYYDSYGTFYGSYCNGNALVNTYANGSGGTYDVTQSNCDCGSCGCGCPPPMSDIAVNCFTHFWSGCGRNGGGYVESNASTTYGNITSHGITSDHGDDIQPGNGNYDGGKQNYYYYFVGCTPFDDSICYTCYAANDTGNYASSSGGCM
jgi:hypothetical protein